MLLISFLIRFQLRQYSFIHSKKLSNFWDGLCYPFNLFLKIQQYGWISDFLKSFHGCNRFAKRFSSVKSLQMIYPKTWSYICTDPHPCFCLDFSAPLRQTNLTFLAKKLQFKPCCKMALCLSIYVPSNSSKYRCIMVFCSSRLKHIRLFSPSVVELPATSNCSVKN